MTMKTETKMTMMMTMTMTMMTILRLRTACAGPTVNYASSSAPETRMSVDQLKHNAADRHDDHDDHDDDLHHNDDPGQDRFVF